MAFEPMERGGIIPQNVLLEHARRTPHQRMLVIDGELAAAAAAGDVMKVRRLQAEKASLEGQQARETAAALASLVRQAKDPPAPGESEELERRAKKVEQETLRRRGALVKLLGRLRENPENERLPDQIDSVKQRLHELTQEAQAIELRQAELSELEVEEEKREELAAKQRAWERARPRYERQLKTAASKIISAWQALDAGMRQIDESREKLRSPVHPAESAATTAEIARIADTTKGKVQCVSGRWIVSLGNGSEVRR